MKKILVSALVLSTCANVTTAATQLSNTNLNQTNPYLAETLSSQIDQSDISQEQIIENINNSLISQNNQANTPPLLLGATTSGPEIKGVNIQKDPDLYTEDRPYYKIDANIDGYDPNKHNIIWQVNTSSPVETDQTTLSSIFYPGENRIEIDLIDQETKRHISTYYASYNTNSDLPLSIDSVTASLIKYYDGLHYNFSAKYNNMDSSKYTVSWQLNGNPIDTPYNVEVPEGENEILVIVRENEFGSIVAQESLSFTAERAPLHISHVLYSMRDDNLHYDFLSLETSFDPDSQYKEWVLNGKVITNVDNVKVNNGENTITLNIRDKKTKEILTTKSNTWDTNKVVGVKAIHADEIENSGGFYYKLSADLLNFDPDNSTIEWRRDGMLISNPDDVWLPFKDNKVQIYIYDKATAELLGASSLHVKVDSILPSIISLSVNNDSEYGLKYSFSANTENDNPESYRGEWLLNGDVITSITGVTVPEGVNTLAYIIYNKHSNTAADFAYVNFTAVNTQPTKLMNYVEYAYIGNDETDTVDKMVATFSPINHVSSVEKIDDSHIKINCEDGYFVTTRGFNLAEGSGVSGTDDEVVTQNSTFYNYSSSWMNYPVSNMYMNGIKGSFMVTCAASLK